MIKSSPIIFPFIRRLNKYKQYLNYVGQDIFQYLLVLRSPSFQFMLIAIFSLFEKVIRPKAYLSFQRSEAIHQINIIILSLQNDQGNFRRKSIWNTITHSHLFYYSIDFKLQIKIAKFHKVVAIKFTNPSIEKMFNIIIFNCFRSYTFAIFYWNVALRFLVFKSINV